MPDNLPPEADQLLADLSNDLEDAHVKIDDLEQRVSDLSTDVDNLRDLIEE